ncbi:MAG: flagellar export chaperone FliS [Spirochaetia bacterium]|nr:flagellar export chaperone FliS [Spirochaetia bacterium]
MKPSANPYLQYKNNSIETAEPKELIVMLYEGAVKFLTTAIENMQSFKTYDIANENIIKTQNIITELMLSLDMDKGGQISESLFNIYAYMKKELLEANVEKNSDKAKRILNYLTDLKNTWQEVDPNKSAASQNKAPIHNSNGEYGGFAAEG